MKQIMIAEQDLEYRRGLAEILIQQGAIPFVFEVSDDFDVDEFEGLEPFNPKAAATQSFSTKFPEVAAWLENYRGTFPFYLSLKDQLASKGMLSEKQIAAVQRAIANDRERGVATPEGKREFSIKPGAVVVLSKFISNVIARQAGYARAHRAFEIVDVEGETEKAYRARVRFTAKPTAHCGICGLTLENKASIAAGIGPICADKLGIDFAPGALSKVATLIPDVEITTWIPKKCIKERVDPVEQDAPSLKSGVDYKFGDES